MVEKKKHPWVMNVLKEFVSTITITKCILDLRMNLTIGELLSSTPSTKRQFTKAITKEKAIPF